MEVPLQDPPLPKLETMRSSPRGRTQSATLWHPVLCTGTSPAFTAAIIDSSSSAFIFRPHQAPLLWERRQVHKRAYQQQHTHSASPHVDQALHPLLLHSRTGAALTPLSNHGVGSWNQLDLVHNQYTSLDRNCKHKKDNPSVQSKNLHTLFSNAS